MTLLRKNRDMPTLSLKGRVCVPLFLFVFVLSQLITTPLYAQDLKNRTEEMHPFGTVIIAKEPLPDKVYESQKNKILISVIYFEKGTSNVVLSSSGTGFVTKTPGVIVTARHLLIETASAYDYVFMGTIITDSAWIDFPLSLIAVGEAGTFKDIMALTTDVEIMQKALTVKDILNPNPYGILVKPSKFADADVGDKVYITGFAPVIAEYPDKNNQSVPVYVDLINFTFPAEVVAPVINMPGNRAGIKKIYKLLDSAEPGFSGGKVINEQGEIVGMTIGMSAARNFVYIISSQDIKQFLEDHKIK